MSGFTEPSTIRAPRSALPEGRSANDPFDEIVRKHGPMVLGVCRRKLADADADDAFQAVFRVFVKTGGPTEGGSVEGWLYKVAVNTARMALRRNRVRTQHERRAARPIETADTHPTTLFDDDYARLMAVIDDEIARLPEAERAAVVAYRFGGRSQVAAATELGWKRHTFQRRLAAGMHRLRCRLTTEGFTSAGLAGVVFAVPVSPALADVTRAGAVDFAVGVPTKTPATLLAQEVLRMVTIKKRLFVSAAAVIGLGLAIGAAFALQPQPEGGVGPPPVVRHGDGLRLQTSAGLWLNVFDSRGAISAVEKPIGNAGRDETLTVLRKNGKGQLSHGDKVFLRSQAGLWLSSFDSRGAMSVAEKPLGDPDRDELFCVLRAKGEGVVRDGDQVYLRTEAAEPHYVNVHDSRGRVHVVRKVLDDPSTDERLTVRIAGR